MMGALVSVPPCATGRLNTTVRISRMPMDALWGAGARTRKWENALLYALNPIFRNAMPQNCPVTVGPTSMDARWEDTVSHRSMNMMGAPASVSLFVTG